MYGDSESLLGKWFRRSGKRDQIFLATKFGYIKGDPNFAVNTSGKYCKKACAESLKLLGVDHIDLCEYSVYQDIRTSSASNGTYVLFLNR